MQKKTLLLLVVLVLLGAALWWFVQPDNGAGNAEGNEGAADFIPALSISETQRIQITTTQSTLTFTRKGQQWHIAEKSQYPVDAQKIYAIVSDLEKASVIEAKTDNPEYYDRLGVRDITDPESKAQQLLLEAENLDEPLELLLGHDTTFGGDSVTYLRPAGAAQSWLVTGNLRQNMTAITWLNKNILNIPAEDIQAMRVVHAGGEVLHVHRENAEQTVFAIHNVPADRELLYPSIGSSLTNALINLQFTDVHSDDDKGLEAVAQTQFTLFDDTIINATVDDQRHLQFTVEGDSERAETLRQAVQGWRFTIAAFKADFFTKRMADMLKPLPEAEPASNASAPFSLDPNAVTSE